MSKYGNHLKSMEQLGFPVPEELQVFLFLSKSQEMEAVLEWMLVLYGFISDPNYPSKQCLVPKSGVE